MHTVEPNQSHHIAPTRPDVHSSLQSTPRLMRLGAPCTKLTGCPGRLPPGECACCRSSSYKSCWEPLLSRLLVLQAAVPPQMLRVHSADRGMRQVLMVACLHRSSSAFQGSCAACMQEPTHITSEQVHIHAYQVMHTRSLSAHTLTPQTHTYAPGSTRWMRSGCPVNGTRMPSSRLVSTLRSCVLCQRCVQHLRLTFRQRLVNQSTLAHCSDDGQPLHVLSCGCAQMRWSKRGPPARSITIAGLQRAPTSVERCRLSS